MELGIISFGTVEKDARTGRHSTSGAAQRFLVEAVKLAEEVGLDYFGIGEHHLPSIPVSQPAVVLAAAAQATSRIRLGSSLTVLGAEDPVRIYEQFATVDGLSQGRAEITVGRGAFLEPFHLYGVDLNGYDALFAEKLDLLAHLGDDGPVVTWQGEARPPLQDADIQPRPDQDWMPVWLGTGGKPGSVLRAARYRLPVMFSAFREPASFAPLAALYREASDRAGSPPERTRIGIASVGYLEPDGARARSRWKDHFLQRFVDLSRGQRTDPGLDALYAQQTRPGGSFFVGSPEEIADRIIALHGVLGHDRQLFESDHGNIPYIDSLRSIELFGTKVKPLVDEALGTTAPAGA